MIMIMNRLDLVAQLRWQSNNCTSKQKVRGFDSRRGQSGQADFSASRCGYTLRVTPQTEFRSFQNV